MALNRYDPFFTFRSPFDDIFSITPTFPISHGSTFLTPGFSSPSSASIQDFHTPRLNSHPPYQVREDDKAYTVAVDVPGLKPDDMKVNVDDDNKVMTLSGERKYKSPDGKTYSERSFSYSMTLGDNVMMDKLSANLEDGVLTLVAPKKPVEKEKIEPPKPKTRRIEISTTASDNTMKIENTATNTKDKTKKAATQ